MSKEALYEAVIECTWPVTGQDGNYKHIYFPIGRPLTVPKGEVVGPSFKPTNLQAEKDREDQLENPDKYHHKDMFRTAVLAELLVKEHGIRDTYRVDENGVKHVTRLAKTEAMSLILGVDDSNIAEAVDPAAVAIADIKSKLDGKAMRKLLKDNGVKFFQGLKESQLAEVIYKEELHKEI